MKALSPHAVWGDSSYSCEPALPTLAHQLRTLCQASAKLSGRPGLWSACVATSAGWPTLQRSSRAADGTPLHIRMDGPGFDTMDVPANIPRPGRSGNVPILELT